MIYTYKTEDKREVIFDVRFSYPLTNLRKNQRMAMAQACARHIVDYKLENTDIILDNIKVDINREKDAIEPNSGRYISFPALYDGIGKVTLPLAISSQRNRQGTIQIDVGPGDRVPVKRVEGNFRRKKVHNSEIEDRS